MNTQELHSRIAQYVKKHPEMSYLEISRTLNIGYSTLTRIAAIHGVRRRQPTRTVNLAVLLGREKSRCQSATTGLNPFHPQKAEVRTVIDAQADKCGEDFFSVWGEQDYEAAVAALKAKESGEQYDESALRGADWDGYDGMFTFFTDPA
jgi:hypothetical protein